MANSVSCQVWRERRGDRHRGGRGLEGLRLFAELWADLARLCLRWCVGPYARPGNPAAFGGDGVEVLVTAGGEVVPLGKYGWRGPWGSTHQRLWGER
ncbi:hypothetical protein ACFPN0_00820 [Kitasatospora cinereorecta]